MATDLQALLAACRTHLPHALRWGGGIARGLRRFDIGIGGKTSGNVNTDALTLADLTCQELTVSFLRDADPIFRECRIEAEEATGELDRFADDSEFTIAIDPIDGTKAYCDRVFFAVPRRIVPATPPEIHRQTVEPRTK